MHDFLQVRIWLMDLHFWALMSDLVGTWPGGSRSHAFSGRAMEPRESPCRRARGLGSRVSPAGVGAGLRGKIQTRTRVSEGQPPCLPEGSSQPLKPPCSVLPLPPLGPDSMVCTCPSPRPWTSLPSAPLDLTSRRSPLPRSPLSTSSSCPQTP